MYVRYFRELDEGMSKFGLKGYEKWAKTYSVNLNQGFKVIGQEERYGKPYWIVKTPEDWSYRTKPPHIILGQDCWKLTTQVTDLKGYM